jgi:hypothetical protein
MDEEQARQILGRMVRTDGGLDSSHDFSGKPGDSGPAILLNGFYTARVLTAIAWWLSNMPGSGLG